MKLKCRLGVLAGLLMACNFAAADGEIYWSVGAGTFDHDRTSVLVRGGGEAGASTWLTSDGDESDLISVSWGVADEQARFLIEYYHQTGDLAGAGAEYNKQSLFYSGYWTPNLYVPKLHGILGAGVGGGELTLESGNVIGDEFQDREAQFKVTAGIEYRLLDLVTFYGTYERHFTRTYSHWSPTRQIDVQDAEQNVLQLGVAARF